MQFEKKSAKLYHPLHHGAPMSRSASILAIQAKVQANSERQDELRRDLALRLDRLQTQIERLFTRSVQFRYSAIRQKRRAAVSALLAPRQVPETPSKPPTA